MMLIVSMNDSIGNILIGCVIYFFRRNAKVASRHNDVFAKAKRVNREVLDSQVRLTSLNIEFKILNL
jgi:hypothetical protein